jgi:predicted ATPase
MEGSRLLRTIQLTNLLSFGPESEVVELEPLNVLIGPNAVGKSNLIEAIGLLKAAPTDLMAPLRAGGGIGEWLWKGGKPQPVAEVNATVSYPQGIMPLRYRLSVTMVGQRLELVDEAIENEHPNNRRDHDVYFFYRYQHGRPVLNVRTESGAQGGTKTGRQPRHLKREDLNPQQSVLSQRKDPDQYPEITYVGKQLEQIRLFSDWNLGRYTPVRLPQPTDLPGDFLLENATNLGVVLNDLQNRPAVKRVLMEKLQRFYDRVEDVTTKIQGGTVQVFFHEQGLRDPIPATRLSDGSLRYLCLLAILCHPSPPPLICIEEPELGLHPDVLPTVADLLVEAAQRTQLVVTTHSDTLIAALSGTPEAILVCERDDGGTHLHRLQPDRLQGWLEKYTLGDLRSMGEIGGRR